MIFKVRADHGDVREALRCAFDKTKMIDCCGYFLVHCYDENGYVDPKKVAEQFRNTKERYAKGKRSGEIQFYSADIYPDPKDKVEVWKLMECASEICDELFRDCEAAIVVHGDTVTPHAHMIINSVNCLTGKQIHYSPSDIKKRNVRAQCVGLKYGFSLAPRGGGG